MTAYIDELKRIGARFGAEDRRVAGSAGSRCIEGKSEFPLVYRVFREGDSLQINDSVRGRDLMTSTLLESKPSQYADVPVVVPSAAIGILLCKQKEAANASFASKQHALR
jgi:hypothetical protein